MSEVLDRTKIYIGGQWVDSDGDGSIEVVDPTTEQVIAKVAEGVVSDVDRAVAAAREAFPAWSALSGAERAAYLEKVSSLANSRVEELTAIVSQDMGMPLSLAKPVQIGMPLKNIAAYAALAGTYDFDDQEIGNALVVREPIGVVGAITPWNYPLHQVVRQGVRCVGGGMHRGSQTHRNCTVDHLSHSSTSSTRQGCRRVSSTSSAGTARWSVRPSPRIPKSTWCRSPVRRAQASASRWSRRRR